MMSKDECSIYEGASTFNFVFLVLITVFIIISYLPQYRRIYLNKTSEGLSSNFLLLGSASSLFTFTNIILVSSKARACCYKLSLFNCINSQTNLTQIGVQCTCAILILICVIVITKDSIKQDKNEYNKIKNIGRVVSLHAFISLIQIVVGLSSNDSVLMFIAKVNGLLSTTLTVVKYIPQIHTTYKLKYPGTLSIGMMCIQTPGGAIFTATLYFTKGSHWSSWVSYFAAFVLQGTLLLLCIYYKYFKVQGLEAELLERTDTERIVEENLEQDNEVAGQESHLLPQ
ncbi:uncharacterized protein PRCAT00003772001 [Priceomyces carsonii]|uniref:uncharacterized protein n=1 Tax=Priceomyces carsonii TaxID=28549 RepID=UPI002ED7A478|nr:unnamed protein product [Priceomyces carsonii]